MSINNNKLELGSLYRSASEYINDNDNDNDKKISSVRKMNLNADDLKDPQKLRKCNSVGTYNESEKLCSDLRKFAKSSPENSKKVPIRINQIPLKNNTTNDDGNDARNGARMSPRLSNEITALLKSNNTLLKSNNITHDTAVVPAENRSKSLDSNGLTVSCIRKSVSETSKPKEDKSSVGTTDDTDSNDKENN